MPTELTFLCEGYQDHPHPYVEWEVAVILDVRLRDANAPKPTLVDLDQLAQELHQNSIDKGFWPEGDDAKNPGELIALMHSELSEWLEAIRHGNPPSEHIPEFSGEEEEAADEIIRVLDACAARKLRIGAALAAKAAFNKTRPYMHGGKKF